MWQAHLYKNIRQGISLQGHSRYLSFVPRRRKKYNIRKRLLWAALVAAAVLVAFVVSIWHDLHDTPNVTYEGFGVELPNGYSIHGIDVSRYQDVIAWEAVRDMQVNHVKIGFAIIKATEGIEMRDPFFKRNWKQAEKAGLVRGAYHFFHPGKSVDRQISNFKKTVTLKPGDLPPVLDVEVSSGLSKKKVRQQVKRWLNAMEAAYGVKPIIYTYASFYEDYFRGYLDDYPLWVAHYFQPAQPRVGRPWNFWQYHDGGRVDGIINKVDLNVFNGDSAAFRSLLLP